MKPPPVEDHRHPPDEPTPFDDAEGHLLRMLGELASYEAKVGDFASPDELAVLAVTLRSVADEVRESAKRTRKMLASAMPGRKFKVDGVGEFTRRRDEKVTWRYEDALERVVARCADDWTPEMPPAAFASLVAHEVAAVAGFSYLRKTALRARRIEPDEFYDAEDHGLEVQLPPKPRPSDDDPFAWPDDGKDAA